MDAIWKQVKSALKNRIPDHSFRMWIEPMGFSKTEGECVFLSCPNFFSRKRVQEQYGDLIQSEINRLVGDSWQFAIEVARIQRKQTSRAVRPKPKPDLQMPLPNFTPRSQTGRMLRKEFTFDQFVVGGNNDYAYSASLALASRRRSSRNSLYLLAKTGMGKSHLSQAIGHYILSEFPNEKVYYITAEDFTNEMVQAFRQDSLVSFKEKYRSKCDVLLLEDVHYLTGKERTQIELAHTLDNLYESGKKIIFSSCYAPTEIPKLSDTLSSRLTSGLVTAIEPPNFRTRVRILGKKAKAFGVQVPDEAIQYLASELTGDIRQLESGLLGVTAKSSLLSAPIDRDLCESVIKTIARSRKKITIESIKKLVCKEFKVSISDVVSRSRKHQFVRPRQISIYLARKYTDSPLQAIGRSFNRYHATALHSINAVEKNMRGDVSLRKQVDLLCGKIESGNL